MMSERVLRNRSIKVKCRLSEDNKRRVLFVDSPAQLDFKKLSTEVKKAMISTSTPRVIENVRTPYARRSKQILKEATNNSKDENNCTEKTSIRLLNRQSTFELDEPSLSNVFLPSVSGIIPERKQNEPSTRRDTFDVDQSVNDVSVLINLSKMYDSRIGDNSAMGLSNITLPKVENKDTLNYFGESSIMTQSRQSCRKSAVKNNSVLKKVTFSENKKSKSKMPNFAKIHQRAAEKMENISELVDRKKKRAQLLLSGQKPLNSSIDLFSEKKCQKMLPFKESPKNIPKEEPKVSKLPLRLKKEEPKVNQLIQDLNEPKISELPQLKVTKPIELKKLKILTQVKEKNQIKQNVEKMVQKKPLVKCDDIRDKNKSAVRGVRSNRRFELLMKMRLGKN